MRRFVVVLANSDVVYALLAAGRVQRNVATIVRAKRACNVRCWRLSRNPELGVMRFEESFLWVRDSSRISKIDRHVA